MNIMLDAGVCSLKRSSGSPEEEEGCGFKLRVMQYQSRATNNKGHTLEDRFDIFNACNTSQKITRTNHLGLGFRKLPPTSSAQPIITRVEA